MRDRLGRQLWVWPLLFAAGLAIFGWTTLRALESTMREQVRSELVTTREAAAAALDIWSRELLGRITLIGADPRVTGSIRALVGVARRSGESRAEILSAPALERLRVVLDDFVSAGDVEGWGVISTSGYMLANDDLESIGHRPAGAATLLGPIREGRPVITPPLEWRSASHPEEQSVTMIAAVPVRDTNGEVVALLGFAIDPEGDFSHILGVARPGETGETYAFAADGRLVSRSRFEDQLRALGLMPDAPGAASTLNVHIRNPGGDLTAGHLPEAAAFARPLTRMAASAIAGETGVDVVGYPDYRGVPVVGSWTWLPEWQLGIATEMDVAEAYAGLVTVRRRLLALIALLGIGALGMLGYSFVVLRLQGQVAKVRQLGRYTVLRKIGKGGMGTVYLARHALLRRPTAVKVLDADRSNTEALARFEREVQVSSSLTHPNTIEIYDYGYTPDGTFYYAMELLRGITIGALVEANGAQCEARAVALIEQACASLAEAHARELIHRDIKPSNIMICEMGGLPDFVKVLDFGLVRPQKQADDLALTSADSLTGTPLYMSPEAVERPGAMDARSDVYQLGAVLYYLLTGSHVFTGSNAVEVLAQHIGETPQPPSERVGGLLSPDLEAIVLRALAKRPEDRPGDAGELLDALEACAIEGRWQRAEASAWWAGFRREHPEAFEDEGASTGSLPSGWEIDLKRRKSEG